MPISAFLPAMDQARRANAAARETLVAIRDASGSVTWARMFEAQDRLDKVHRAYQAMIDEAKGTGAIEALSAHTPWMTVAGFQAHYDGLKTAVVAWNNYIGNIPGQLAGTDMIALVAPAGGGLKVWTRSPYLPSGMSTTLKASNQLGNLITALEA